MKKVFLLALLAAPLTVWAQAEVNPDSVVTFGELEEIVVSSTRLQSATPITTQQLSSADLQQQNTGVNLPYLLQSTPSLVVTSDDGLGVGYTYFRVRGTDQSRINMTINGVPLNDSESQTVFCVHSTR